MNWVRSRKCPVHPAACACSSPVHSSLGDRVRSREGGSGGPIPRLTATAIWGGNVPRPGGNPAGRVLPSSSARRVGLSPCMLAGGSGGRSPNQGTSAEPVQAPPSHAWGGSPTSPQLAPHPLLSRPPPATQLRVLRHTPGGGGSGGGRGESSHSSPPHVYPSVPPFPALLLAPTPPASPAVFTSVPPAVSASPQR